jgi:hypothetical protein
MLVLDLVDLTGAGVAAGHGDRAGSRRRVIPQDTSPGRTVAAR